jgi:probable rRNA maturation factor
VATAPVGTVYVKRVRAGRAVPSATIARRASRLLGLLGMRGAELSIVLCDDAFIRTLNREFRGFDRATDVLSFSQDGAGAGGSTLLGDVVISLETAARQARRRRGGLLEEATALLVHGVLHLAGHDHERAREAREMAALADRLEKELRSPRSRLTVGGNSTKKAPRAPRRKPQM